MKHKKNGNRYKDDFRKMIVDLYHSGQKVKGLSNEYGVSEVTIYKWIKDFTPVVLDDGWCYLASVMDLHSKRIVGYSFGRKMTIELVTKALKNAYHTQKPDDKLIFHSDLGTQYTNDEFGQIIKAFNMTHSFSYKGSPYDNACIESFHAILKKEEAGLIRYLDYESTQLALFKYIEGWYNRKRIHSSIDYLTP